ncbi:hypothetical protein [Robertmurraya korlensis]|uniref:hypothetical protein n=1 Tax=Robertmurraya korlensis TaxID=519977 RepID=UPI000AF9D852|nr:hypothetical protein [Robertmurraya korlensis]
MANATFDLNCALKFRNYWDYPFEINKTPDVTTKNNNPSQFIFMIQPPLFHVALIGEF